jgi:hypothetical protein
MLMSLGHSAGQQMYVVENNGYFYHHLKVIVYLIGKTLFWNFLCYIIDR